MRENFDQSRRPETEGDPYVQALADLEAAAQILRDPEIKNLYGFLIDSLKYMEEMVEPAISETLVAKRKQLANKLVEKGLGKINQSLASYNPGIDFEFIQFCHNRNIQFGKIFPVTINIDPYHPINLIMEMMKISQAQIIISNFLKFKGR